MGYKQSPGRKNMPKTGRGIDAAALMTGSPAKQMSQAYYDKGNKIARDSQGKGKITENSSTQNKLRGVVPAAKGTFGTKKDILDGDNDGDTVFNDSNDDGNMVSRGFSSLVKAGQKIKNAISADFSDGGAEAKRKLRVDRGSIK